MVSESEMRIDVRDIKIRVLILVLVEDGLREWRNSYS